MSSPLFTTDSPSADAIHAFWRSLHDPDDPRQDRAGRAELRRAHTPTEVVICPAYFRLLHGLRAGFDAQDLPRERLESDRGRTHVAILAGLIAHVRQGTALPDHAHTTAGLIAKPDAKAQRPAISELRFRRLIQAETASDLYPLLRRTLAQLDGTANVLALARDVWHWGDRRRRQWAYEFYDLRPSQPDSKAKA